MSTATTTKPGLLPLGRAAADLFLCRTVERVADEIEDRVSLLLAELTNRAEERTRHG
jgi:hypothetical protein